VARWTYLAAPYRKVYTSYELLCYWTTRYNECIQKLSCIVSWSTAALPHRQPATAGTSCDRCCDRGNDKRSTSISWSFLISLVLPCRYTITKWILCTVQGLIALGQLHFTLQGVVILTMTGHPLFSNDIYTGTKKNNNNNKWLTFCLPVFKQEILPIHTQLQEGCQFINQLVVSWVIKFQGRKWWSQTVTKCSTSFTWNAELLHFKILRSP